MAVALEQFVKQLADSGVIAPGKLENFVPPKSQPKDAQELARQLVQSKQLTKFQVQEIYQGRAGSLLLGNYTILDKIGAGGMGQVFKAQHRRMERTVAIKVPPKNVMRDAATIARFEREVRAAAKLSHPNIVTAFDADEAGGINFLVMEFAEGSDLSALVKKNGPFSTDKAVNYILQAARGLEFAHGEGIVHRDIKPANLLLDKKGTVKILDMGLARIEAGNDAATQAELTGTGAVLGTVDYMAPEQALDTKHVDGRADIYSLGCSLFYLLTGKPLYEAETLTAKLLAHQSRPIPDLRKIRNEVPAELEAVFKKMVAKKIEDRYQTISEVVAELQECVAATSTAGNSQTIAEPSSANSNLSFLAEATARTQHHGQTKQAKQLKKEAEPTKKSSGWNRKQLLLVGGAVGGGLLAAAILAAVVFKMQTKDGTLVVEVNQPDSVVQVLDAEGKVEISQPDGKGAISISVDPGKHRLKVEKQGFQFFAKDFELESGGTASIKATLVEDKPWFKPAFLAWQKEVAALPAERQVEAVTKKLQEINPGFDRREIHKIDNGVVVEFEFDSVDITDISPVRALSGLNKLATGCFGGRGKVSDLSPLHGLQLTTLSCAYSLVSDLSPLKGMPLKKLACGFTQVSNLTPLEGIPLTYLGVQHTLVSDLSPLKAMPLTDLNCDNTPVSDLSVVRGMALTAATLTPENITMGLEVIRQMKSIKMLGIEYTNMIPAEEFWQKYDAGEFGKPNARADAADHKPITDFNSPAFQQWMKDVAALPAEKQVDAVAKKLQELNPEFDGDVTPISENGTLTGLVFFVYDVSDISPVRALQGLKKLGCRGSATKKGRLSDLTPLQGMKLTVLSCDYSQVSNLLPLRGMPLTELWLGTTPVFDLSPLSGMPLSILSIVDSQVSDLSPLHDMPLEEIFLTPKDITKGMETVRSLKSVETIGVAWESKWSPADFWKKYDAGEFSK